MNSTQRQRGSAGIRAAGTLVGGARVLAATTIATVMLLAAFSLWTVIPFGWLWIGSKLSSSQAPSMGPYAVVFIGIVTSIIIVVVILSWLSHLYERLLGTTELQVERVRMFKSLSDERKTVRRWSVLEAVVLASVIVAIIAMGVWFLFVAGSPLPNQ